MSRDLIFLFVLGIVLANLALSAAKAITALTTDPLSLGLWCWLIANTVAIIGVLWFLDNYRKRRKLKKLLREQEEQGDEDEQD